MAIQTVIAFQNCASAVEDVRNPQTGEVVGKVFVIIDEENKTVYQYSMPLEAAKTQGQRLLGIGDVAIANGAGLKEAIAKQQRPKKS